MTLSSFVLLVVSVAAFPQQPPTPPRDTPRPGAGTASVSGRVTDKDSGEPIARAVVSLVQEAREGREPRHTVTADDGRFAFTGLPPGAYFVAAEPGPHRPSNLSQAFGDEQPLNAFVGRTSHPKPLLLREGESRGSVDIALPRAFAFGGIVVNEFGEPLANVHVTARLVRAGRPVMGALGRSTDDCGAFRLFGLRPGRYRVCAESRDQPTDHRQSLDRLVTTCYPSATREEDAGVVVLGGADERWIQIRMQQSRTFTITGVVLDSSGAPASNASLTMGLRNGLQRTSGLMNVGADGRFTISHLIPGEYGVRAYVRASAAGAEFDREVAYERVRVESADVHVVLSMKETATIAGHLMFADTPAPARGSQRRLTVAAYDGASGLALTRPTPVSDRLTFELHGVYGPVVFVVEGLPDEWVLGSVHYGGVDVTDTPTEFMTFSNAAQLRVTLTRRTAALTGRVVDADGAAVAGGDVYLFPAAPPRWGRFQGLRQKASDSTGAFTFDGVRPGEYFVVAVRSENAPEMFERQDYELLAKVAERVALAEGSNPPITLRVVRVPEDP